MYSNDNGVTWTRSSSSNLAAASNLTSVSCVTASFCVAVGSPAAGANPGIALYTTNGGLDWTVGSQSGLPDPTTISGKFNSVSCASTQDCVAVGNYYTTANPSSYTSTTAYYTTDGGLDWGDGPVPTAGTHCDSDGYSGCTFYSVSCVPGGSLCVAIGTASATSVESYSDDNGATWTSSTDPYTWGTTGYYGNWMVAADVSCPAADLCMLNYQGGEYSQTASTLLSTDGGVTWSGGGNGTPGIPTSFFCLSTSLCIQGGHGASQWGDDGSGAYSVDGGNNWIYSNFTNNPSWLGLNSISCTGVYACVALGNDNYVYLSN
jgi:hypothetical protein